MSTDEPSTGVDDEDRRLLREILHFYESGTALPEVTPFRAARHADRKRLDVLVKARFLVPLNQRYCLTIDGLLACDSVEARTAYGRCVKLLSELKDAYLANPNMQSWSLQDFGIRVRRSAQEVARLLAFMNGVPGLVIHSFDQNTGFVQSFRVIEDILDATLPLWPAAGEEENPGASANLMLHKIRIRGYRALKDFEIDLPAGRPLVLIGENATGKSTILDAISMICAVANGRAGRAILDRGGWAAVSWAGTSSDIELTVRFSDGAQISRTHGGPVEYMVRLGSTRSIPTVLDEEVRYYHQGLDGNPFVHLKGGAARWVTNERTGAREPVTPAPSDGSIVTNSVLAAISDEARYPTCMHVKEALQDIALYPSFALGSGEGARDPLGARQVELTRRINSSGRDLLNALHTLSTQHPREWESLLTDLRAVFPWCQSLRFPPGPGRGLITLTWLDSRSGATLYLDDMSEGMRVYLALCAALHAPDSPALIGFDEPERSLHPRALRRFVKVMESRAEHVPIIVATHSDRLLDYLESPAEVLRITRFSSTTGVRVEQRDADHLEAWLKDYTLSELRARDMLEAPIEEGEPSS
jgi:predicted ATPase